MATASGSLMSNINTEINEEELQDLTDEQLEQMLDDALLVTGVVAKKICGQDENKYGDICRHLSNFWHFTAIESSYKYDLNEGLELDQGYCEEVLSTLRDEAASSGDGIYLVEQSTVCQRLRQAYSSLWLSQ